MKLLLLLKNQKKARKASKKHLVYLILIILISITIMILILDFKSEYTLNQEDNFLNILYNLLFILIILFSSLSLKLSYDEFKEIIFSRSNKVNGTAKLTLGDVFDNNNRKKIIREILEEPGIHYKELFRRCNIASGQLQWHLMVLEEFEIIENKIIGQYSSFLPITAVNFDLTEIELKKSKTTYEILQIIEQNPKITASNLSKQLKLKKNTINYHVDKLIKRNLIKVEIQGKEKALFITSLNKYV